MPRLTWKDGESHDFVVIGREGSKRHFDRKNKRFVPCEGKEKCWWCRHGYDYQGVVIGVAVYAPREVDGTHFPWLSLTPNAYKAIRKVLGVLPQWYGHKIALTRKGSSFDTRYTAKDKGVCKDVDLMRWAKEREAELTFDAGEEWGEEAGEEEEQPREEVVLEREAPEEEDQEGQKAYLQNLIESARKQLEEMGEEE